MPIIGAFMVPHPLSAIPEIGKGKENELSATTSSFNLVAKKSRNYTLIQSFGFPHTPKVMLIFSK